MGDLNLYYSELKQKMPSAPLRMISATLKTPSWLDGGQCSPAMCSVFELDGSRTAIDHLEGWHSNFNSIISRRHPNSYIATDWWIPSKKSKHLCTELTAVQLDAGSHDTQM